MGQNDSRPLSEARPERKRVAFDPTKVFVAPKIDIPLDPDDSRYVKSFTLDEKDSFVEFFKEFGFVVVRDVLTAEECRKSIDDIWTFLESGSYQFSRWFDDLGEKDEGEEEEGEKEEAAKDSRESGIKRDDPKTWSVWPPLSHAGILGYLPVFTPQALMNRQNPKVYDAFSSVMGRKDLMVSHDRFGLFRPVCNTEGEEVNRQWKTRYSLHWDLNPWRFSLEDEHIKSRALDAKKNVSGLTYEDPSHFFLENNEIGTERDGQVGTQGILNFADNLVEDGGFQMVVGFHKHIGKWAESTKDSLGEAMLQQDFVPVNSEDPLYKQAQRVSLRAGSLIIWDQRIAHGSAPNSSANTRFCQFIKMSPAIDLNSPQGKNRIAVVGERVGTSSVEVSDLGRRLFAFDPWQ